MTQQSGEREWLEGLRYEDKFPPCDSCLSDTKTEYSPAHDANFCARCAEREMGPMTGTQQCQGDSAA